MIPKEKAKDLVFSFTKLETNNNSYAHDVYCALIVVDELIKQDVTLPREYTSTIGYWQEVKSELQKMQTQ